MRNCIEKFDFSFHLYALCTIKCLFPKIQYKTIESIHRINGISIQNSYSIENKFATNYQSCVVFPFSQIKHSNIQHKNDLMPIRTKISWIRFYICCISKLMVKIINHNCSHRQQSILILIHSFIVSRIDIIYKIVIENVHIEMWMTSSFQMQKENKQIHFICGIYFNMCKANNWMQRRYRFVNHIFVLFSNVLKSTIVVFLEAS